MTRAMKAALGLGALSLLTWFGACSDSQGVTDPPTSAGAAIVSDPVSDASPVEPDVAFISLPPKAVANGVSAVITSPRMMGSVTAAVTDGGFDPVPIAARPGDVVEIEIRLTGGGTSRVTHGVPARRPPRTVRTVPPRGKTDVTVNSRMVVVFSEPVAEGTLPSAVQLFQGGSAVPGTVRLVQGTTAQAVFEPAAPLQSNTPYRLVVTEGVRDLQGDALEAELIAEFTTGTTTAGPATVVTVLPDTTALAIGSQVQLVATAQDTNLTVIAGRPVTWTTDNAAVATVSATGLVTARAEGVAPIRGEMDGRSDVGVVVVATSLAPLASVEVTPSSPLLLDGGLVQLRAVMRDAAGNVIQFRNVEWESSAPAVASVTAGPGGTAVVRRVAPGTVTITATSEGKRGTATITHGTVGPYARISGSCAVTSDDRAWCWGSNWVGNLGNGTRLSTLVPSAVAGELSFTDVAAGDPRVAHHPATCALTASSAAYCWGSNWNGSLGIGTAAPPGSTCDDGFLPCMSLTPVAVSGGLRFSAIDASDHICALTPTGLAYCWGLNVFGQLGVGTTNGPERCFTAMGEGDGCSTVPAAVAGGRTYTAIATGYMHTCALTSTGVAYCWGWNNSGVLGTGFAAGGALLDRPFPVQVAGGLRFVAITAGGVHTCGLTSDGAAYCWGANGYGELGIGTTTGPQSCSADPVRANPNCSPVPVPVAGNLRFTAISAGWDHTCALTTTGAAYCWGANGYGQLGVGMASESMPTPTAVAGGLTFARLSAGMGSSCGLTMTGVAYCWGNNEDGQLGNGSTTNSSVPVRVAGQP